MATATIKSGQTLMDFAIEHHGAVEAAVDIALALGVSLTATPEVGTRLPLSRTTYDRVMQAHCQAYQVSPATLDDGADMRWRIFGATFSIEYK